MSILRRHGSHSPGQLFSLSLVEAEDGWSRFSLSKGGQLIQQWWPPCNFWMAQSHAACSMGLSLIQTWRCTLNIVLIWNSGSLNLCLPVIYLVTQCTAHSYPEVTIFNTVLFRDIFTFLLLLKIRHISFTLSDWILNLYIFFKSRYTFFFFIKKRRRKNILKSVEIVFLIHALNH